MTIGQFSLEGRIALISGASSGIGRTLAKGLSAAGANVVAVARRIDRLEDVVAEIEQQGGSALAAEVDVTDAESTGAAIASTRDMPSER